MSNKSSVSSQVISLPKGGGAVKGIGETFQPNLFSGTGNHSIPIALSPGRNGFGPALSLQYSSGNGNGPFGLGWQLSIPRITRKTERGLPQQVYGARVTDSMLGTDGGYVHSEGDDNWWITSGLAFYSPNVADSPAQELAFAQQHFFLPHRARDPFGNTAFVTYDPYDFQPKQTIDPLGNRTTAEHNYRLLQPFRLTDPNGNRAEVAFDTLGLVAGTAVMGKAPETKGDSLVEFVGDLTPQQRQDFLADPLGHAPLLLGHATTRILYDLDRYLTLQQPVFAATIARQTHTSDPLPPSELKFHVSLGYSDGFGREIQKKIQAEPGPVVDGGPTIAPRWVGSGWTIFNNKGKPIKQYEPFFDDTHAFWFANQVGVSSTLFYDPIERVVATLHPDYTWEKVVFNPWRQETWDVNDTVLIADPKNDPDVGEFFQRLADSDYLPTWHTQRHGGGLGALEQAAAAKTEVHAATPSIVYADSLGRTFLTVAHNRFERNGTMLEEKYATRVDLDIEGNQRKVIDAKDRVVMRYDYDMLGTRIHLASMEAGQRWMLNDVAGRPIYAWNSRDHRLRTTYDALRRPAESYLHEGTGSELMIGRTLYGESRPDAEGKNQRGKVIQLFDQAGVVTSDDYDFKGNLLSRGRQLARDYTTTLDWSTNPELEPETFTGSTTYYALNRPLTATSPDGSVYRPTFNEANLLERLEVNLRGAPTATPFVTDINYDAKGQRVLIEYGNSVRTNYDYGPLTFRLTRLKTVRGAKRLQGLHYTYDPAGNIAHIQDNAQQTIYFNNQAVSPNNDYTYDAVYRLITAKGREHIGQASQPRTTWDDQFRVHLPHPGDGQAMRRYTEFYEYDAVGNFLQLIHQAVSGNWTRGYTYNEPSLIDPGKNCNRLSSTTVGGNSPETYAYDAHGNMTAMPHLSLMQWDYRDQLQATSRQVVTDGSRETTWYVYDAGGQRVRKITERQNGTRKNERTYLGGFEVYREYRRQRSTRDLGARDAARDG